MKIYHLKRTQILPISSTEAWSFFSSPRNLQDLTPKKIKFKIISISGDGTMYPGQIIRYKIKVPPFWTVNWVSEITHVHEGAYFVDDQRFGPYALWHHRHSFRQMKDCVEMTDEVHYAIPYGVIGRLANWLFVERSVNAIFDFRYTILENRFGKMNVVESEVKPFLL
jgi:ligand-binding SRPBCC domain-containing protein